MSKNIRIVSVLFFIAIIVISLFSRSIYLMVGENNRINSDLIIASRTPLSLDQLNIQAVKLKKIADNIDSYSFGQIKQAINETVNLVKISNREINAQYEAWLNVKSKINVDTKHYVQLKHQLSKIQELQTAEIIRLRLMLKNAERPSIIVDIWNLILTFVLGVSSSFAASLLWKKYKSRSQEKT